MKFRFTPEHFEFLLTLQPSGQKVVLKAFGYEGYDGMKLLYVVLAEQAAAQANALLEAEEKKCPRLTPAEWRAWLEKMRQGFYLGCRTDAHSDQVNEFVNSCNYYLDNWGVEEIK